MDKLLLIGSEDQKLSKFLVKLGYEVLLPEPASPICEVLEKKFFDLVLIESGKDHLAVQLCEFLRKLKSSNSVPIVCVTGDALERVELKRMQLDKFELIEAPYSIGGLAARIATQLRLAKISGADERTASLVEMNAALRDLNGRFTKEVEEARQIQESLLPETLPVDSRYAVAASYQPLTEVGGDWYYVNVGPSGKVTLQIADVTGHGLSAALIGSMTKLALSAAARELPHELLGEMNRLMSPQLPAGRFVTVSSCLYDPVNGEVHVARAGHPPAFVLHRASGKVEQLKGSGFPLGFCPDTEYSVETSRLEVGDALVLITDGISEASNRNNELYGFERLSAAFSATKPQATAAQLIEEILGDFDRFRDNRMLKDDVTIVALKRLK